MATGAFYAVGRLGQTWHVVAKGAARETVASAALQCEPAHGGGMAVEISHAEPDEYAAVVSLLQRSGLPEAGLAEHRDGLLVARDGRAIVGSVALELRAEGVLLRSLAVAPTERSAGLGGRLVDAALDLARSHGAGTSYLLTETAPQFFARRGFLPVTRSRVPASIKLSVEFGGACCSSALAMARPLATPVAGPRGLVVRAALGTDAAAIAHIYSQGIDDRLGTFETRPRTAEDVRSWFDGPHPIVVVEEAGSLVAFASTSSYRPQRACYAGIGEFSVYVERSARGRGLGRAAMVGLIDAVTRAGFWKLLSRVFVENAPSRALLRSLGFREVGTYEKHGKLDGRWRDVVIVERLIADNLT
ncbi:MAG: arsinothricin resistance N-acetyltransferase ArsN1 family A [Vicinamibacterales bacterium]